MPASPALALSPIIAGLWRATTWNLDAPARVRWIEKALELGITSFDHADIYGDYRAEAWFGDALKAAPALRQRIQLISKCGIRLRSDQLPYRLNHYDSSPAYVRSQVERSLRHLQTDQLDLVLIHRPDYLMDAAALAETFRQLTAEGKVAHWGVSNYNVQQFALLQQHHPLMTNQVELSPLALEALDDGTLEQAQRLGVRPMAWSPLAGGRIFDPNDARAARVLEVMRPMAERYGVSANTLIFAWILRHPARPYPITGSGRIERLAQAVAALDVRMEVEDWYAIWVASKGHGVA